MTTKSEKKSDMASYLPKIPKYYNECRFSIKRFKYKLNIKYNKQSRNIKNLAFRQIFYINKVENLAVLVKPSQAFVNSDKGRRKSQKVCSVPQKSVHQTLQTIGTVFHFRFLAVLFQPAFRWCFWLRVKAGTCL